MADSDLRFNRLESFDYSSPKSIVKDKYGLLWIGTNDGLYKYDGYSYQKYVNKSKTGIASYPEDGADVETLQRNADTAMYSVKYKDKNNYQFFTDSMN